MYFVPAGYVFSIWGIIYLALIGFVAYQALPSQRANPALRRVGYLFALSCLANSAWIFCWHYELFALTEVAMVSLLVLLIAIYLRLGIGHVQVTAAERWLVHVPVSIYLGWITVASIANTTDLLYNLGVRDGLIGAATWAAILLVIATAITLAMIFTRGDIAYALVIIWAFVGIVVKQGDTPLVAVTAGITAAVVALALPASLFLFRGPRSRLTPGSV